MRVYIDLDTRAIIVAPTVQQRVDAVYFTRRDSVPIEVQFCRAGVVQDLGTLTAAQVGIKATYAGSVLAGASSWTKTGTGDAATYTFILNLNVAGINALFPLDTEDEAAGKFEATWTVSGATTSTLPCPATVYNDVLRGTEGDPLATATASAFRLQSANGTVWRFTVDNSGVLTPSVDGTATAAPSALTLISANFTAYLLTVGNDGVLKTDPA